MTSGQGSAPESGQPPYGQPPEGAPPYGAPPPQGQPGYGPPPQGPPGYPPYGPPQGYMPAPAAPSGWGQEAPRPLERPVTVRAGLGAFIASIVLSLVGSVVTLLNWDRFIGYIEAQTQGQLDTANSPISAEEAAALGLRIGIIFGIILLALYLLFIWFAWRGYNWARIVLWVLGGIGLVFGVIGLAAGSSTGPFPFVTALGWFQYLFTAVGVVLLALKPSNEWFRYRKWLRATGQPG
jgi:hypothetical protein